VRVTVEMKQFPSSLSQIFVAALKTDTSPSILSCCVPPTIDPALLFTVHCARLSMGEGAPSGVYVCW
jgi:hypothetical protein